MGFDGQLFAVFKMPHAFQIRLSTIDRNGTTRAPHKVMRVFRLDGRIAFPAPGLVHYDRHLLYPVLKNIPNI